MIIVCAALIVFIVFLTVEHVLMRYARKRYSLVIHVNGTRGKSTVTRMIHALLRCQGMAVFGKTTGSKARFLLPDGTEKSVRRFGPANVREQRNMMILGAFSGKPQKRALVFECNAVKEELQCVSMKWLKPDITVITNVREDHVRELGKPEQAALAFAAAIPENSVLVTSDGNFRETWEAAAKQKKLRFFHVEPKEAGNCAFPENVACVLGVADYLGIDRTIALKSIAEHEPDAGAFGIYTWKTNANPVFFADARAANDVESTERLFAAAFHAIKPDKDAKRILLIINREDRPERTWGFLQYIIDQNSALRFDQYFCLGHVPLPFRTALKRKGINFKIIRGAKDLDCELGKLPEHTVFISGAGNYGGAGELITQWLETKRHEPDFTQISETSIWETVQQ
jgi:poly-gamma-glutamate synthase PgsB/CapB